MEQTFLKFQITSFSSRVGVDFFFWKTKTKTELYTQKVPNSSKKNTENVKINKIYVSKSSFGSLCTYTSAESKTNFGNFSEFHYFGCGFFKISFKKKKSATMAANYKAQLAQMFTSAGGSHRDLAEKYKAVLDSILQLGEDELVDGLKAFIEAIVNENVSLVISRQLLSEVAMEMAKVEDSISKAASHYTLDIVQPRVISFEDQVGLIRQHLADIYEKEQNWKQAAQVLVGIPLETGQKQYTVDYRLETYLKIARLYLEDEDPVQGEAYINRAAQLQTQTRNDHLQIIYKVHTNFAF